MSLHGNGRPEALGAPTEMFGRVDELAEPPQRPALTPVAAQHADGGYLTEVEKVQLRRKHRGRKRGGRHRR